MSSDQQQIGELEDEPDVVAERFPTARVQLVQLANDLYEQGERLGLLGPREYGRLWSRHLLNCAAVEERIPEGARVADVGSGAGLPGLVLAIIRPDAEFTLIDPMERRCTWLEDESARLGLTNVRVIRARSQEVTDEVMVDVVTARAVSALKTLIGWTAPLLRPGGSLVLMKGRSAAAEIEAASKPIRKFALQDVHVEHLGADYLSEPTTVVCATLPTIEDE
ncbi:16S rRNA (guanine(527)-N(7))-methyltransferase RsmG [Pseudoclavibacter sp. CFCC 11306]|uniref:16S rRNA (guanine(527)-N(7))-methyltransferase RsmG n=1 Tax=Pseudoclavibacter sp. CFCC 11306 TaxID=1564493 RepID=UPI001300FC28|nr:16S rRNA (guanine(527)-N(7))-methyltransferase RsmG [Pseudoclavibacter sp. CFCC 11306]KAB1657416.1 16S rRNA (guanine(527)-N(7))-methyltransferase RsmG [Pseudoclavibacter sp. CFCC 11306]